MKVLPSPECPSFSSRTCLCDQLRTECGNRWYRAEARRRLDCFVGCLPEHLQAHLADGVLVPLSTPSAPGYSWVEVLQS